MLKVWLREVLVGWGVEDHVEGGRRSKIGVDLELGEKYGESS